MARPEPIKEYEIEILEDGGVIDRLIFKGTLEGARRFGQRYKQFFAPLPKVKPAPARRR